MLWLPATNRNGTCPAIPPITRALHSVEFLATLDANEQYAGPAALRALCAGLNGDPALAALRRRLLYIEQPMPRELTRTIALNGLGGIPFIIDEADDSYDAFPAARALGYAGVSSKSCKGLYKSLLNGARAAAWNSAEDRGFFVAAEDLTCQAGLAVQQDTALAAFLGIEHAERNGHHYVDGFAGSGDTEERAFLAAHPDLYEEAGGRVRLRVQDGALATGSLAAPGFAAAAFSS